MTASEAKNTIDLVAYLRGGWEKRTTIVSIEISLLLLLLFEIFSNALDLTNADPTKVIKSIPYILNSSLLFGMMGGSLWIFWYLTNRPKRTVKRKIGVLFAVETENEVQKRRILKDFSEKVKGILAKDSGEDFQVNFLSEYYCQRIAKDSTFAGSLLNATKATLILFGSIEERKVNSKDHYSLRLNVTVRHRNIPIEVSREFSKDIDSVFPKTTMFEIDNEYLGFQITSELVGEASRFILGVASAYSGKLELAYAMHKETLQYGKHLLQMSAESHVAKALVEKSRQNIVKECVALIGQSYKIEKNIASAFSWANRALEHDSNCYAAMNMRSIYFFRMGNVGEALREVDKESSDKVNFTWAYNKAFLLCAQGKLDDAYHLYCRVVQKPVPSHIHIECELFITDYLEENENQFELYYALGLINYLKKEDFVLAAEYFSTFINRARVCGKYARNVAYADGVIQKCKRRLEAVKI